MDLSGTRVHLPVDLEKTCTVRLNPLKPNSSNYYTWPSRWPGSTYMFNFWRSGTLALSPERQGARMSEIENGRRSLYGPEQFEM